MVSKSKELVKTLTRSQKRKLARKARKRRVARARMVVTNEAER
jgi:hypothetical protein